MANLDPLGLDQRPTPVELDPALYGFKESDLDRECAPHDTPVCEECWSCSVRRGTCTIKGLLSALLVELRSQAHAMLLYCKVACVACAL